MTAAAALPPAEAAAWLGEALDRWRGPAYAEFADEDWTRAERSRLAELRVPPEYGRNGPRLKVTAGQTVGAVLVPPTCHPALVLASERDQRPYHLVQVGAKVGRCAAHVVAAVVPDVGPGDTVSEVALDPGERRMAQPMGCHLLRGQRAIGTLLFARNNRNV
ncbi:bacterial transcriptional activator domain-containing protein [Streptosporangium sp. NPDC048047]|uniref:bacterial transcriptional activator domain-containing protein n=1 Tax=Streptosporangium sp. NPDC048047 TaxID=3155748 RepID=UPI0034332D08